VRAGAYLGEGSAAAQMGVGATAPGQGCVADGLEGGFTITGSRRDVVQCGFLWEKTAPTPFAPDTSDRETAGPVENLVSLDARLKAIYLRVRQVRLDPDLGRGVWSLDPFLIIGRWGGEWVFHVGVGWVPRWREKLTG
jgi:hypothetical protein